MLPRVGAAAGVDFCGSRANKVAATCLQSPPTGQVQQLVLALEAAGFAHLETFETMKRGWHVTERSVRPDHRMVGHTGFVTIARRVGRSD